MLMLTQNPPKVIPGLVVLPTHPHNTLDKSSQKVVQTTMTDETLPDKEINASTCHTQKPWIFLPIATTDCVFQSILKETVSALPRSAPKLEETQKLLNRNF